MRGSNVSESKMRIIFHFIHQRTSKENVDFLKDGYGNGGGTWGNSNRQRVKALFSAEKYISMNPEMCKMELWVIPMPIAEQES